MIVCMHLVPEAGNYTPSKLKSFNVSELLKLLILLMSVVGRPGLSQNNKCQMFVRITSCIL